MDLELAGKKVTLTGASRGIGLAIARALIREGCQVHLVARDENALTQVCEELMASGGDVSMTAADLSTSTGIARLADRWQVPDILVNNAGDIPAGGLLDLAEEQVQRAWELKLMSYMRLSQMAFGGMRRRRSGVILNVIGTAGERPRASYAAGSMANAALIAMTRSLGLEAKSVGVRVVGLHPGATLTERKVNQLRVRATLQFGDAEAWPCLSSRYPYGRLAAPDEIADAAVFLCSSRASYINATCLTIDGGATDDVV